MIDHELVSNAFMITFMITFFGVIILAVFLIGLHNGDGACPEAFIVIASAGALLGILAGTLASIIAAFVAILCFKPALPAEEREPTAQAKRTLESNEMHFIRAGAGMIFPHRKVAVENKKTGLFSLDVFPDKISRLNNPAGHCVRSADPCRLFVNTNPLFEHGETPDGYWPGALVHGDYKDAAGALDKVKFRGAEPVEPCQRRMHNSYGQRQCGDHHCRRHTVKQERQHSNYYADYYRRNRSGRHSSMSFQKGATL